MASTLVELTASIVASHAVGTELTGDELIQEINTVFATLKQLETGVLPVEAVAEIPKITMKQAFRNDQVTCMVCGKGGFKTLTRHLKQAHDLKPGQYRKQFNIPSSQSLTAKNYSEARRQSANNNNLAANLEKARAVRAAKIKDIGRTDTKVVDKKSIKTPAGKKTNMASVTQGSPVQSTKASPKKQVTAKSTPSKTAKDKKRVFSAGPGKVSKK